MLRAFGWGLVGWIASLIGIFVVWKLVAPNASPEAARVVGQVVAVPSLVGFGLPFFLLGLVSAARDANRSWATGVGGSALKGIALIVLIAATALFGKGALEVGRRGVKSDGAQRVEAMLFHAGRRDDDSATKEFADAYSLDHYQAFLAFAKQLGIDDRSVRTRVVDSEPVGDGAAELVTVAVGDDRRVIRVVPGRRMELAD